jgi:hypothetical protein
MRGGNCNTDANLDIDTDRYTGYVQLVDRAEYAYCFD